MKSSPVYKDSFDEKVDLIAKAKEKELISDEEMSFLLGVLIRKNTQEETLNAIFQIFEDRRKQEEKQTFFINMTSKRKHYA